VIVCGSEANEEITAEGCDKGCEEDREEAGQEIWQVRRGQQKTTDMTECRWSLSHQI